MISEEDYNCTFEQPEEVMADGQVLVCELSHVLVRGMY